MQIPQRDHASCNRHALAIVFITALYYTYKFDKL